MRASVLVGEDDDGIQGALFELLTSAGYEVVVADDGRDMKQLIEDGLRPSVILLDLMMPGANGYDFLAWRATCPQARHLPVVVYSASNFNEMLLRSFAVTSVLTKPADADGLLIAIANATAVSQPHGSAG
jgi:CheY-like chemotaxis protein